MNLRNMNYNKKLLFLVGWLLMPGIFHAQNITEKRTIDKSFKASPHTSVDITNKYGKIHVMTWNQDSVRVKVIITYRAPNQSKLAKIKSNVDFEIIGTPGYVTAKSVFGNNYRGFLSEIVDMTENIFSSEKNMEIDYEVTLPEYLNLSIDNKYGNVYINNHTGNFNLSLSYGDFKANNLGGNVNLDIRFGDGVINSINTGRISLLYSNFSLDQANNITITSKSSELRIEAINILKTDSRRDKYYITELNSFYGKSTFSDISIRKIFNDVNYTPKYGSISMEWVSKVFSLINFNSKYTDISMFFEKDAGYNVDISYKNAELSYPESLARLNRKPDPDDDKSYILYGSIGTVRTSSKLRIDAEFGNIKLFHK